jgi:hypothetical protein
LETNKLFSNALFSTYAVIPYFLFWWHFRGEHMDKILEKATRIKETQDGMNK